MLNSNNRLKKLAGIINENTDDSLYEAANTKHLNVMAKFANDALNISDTFRQAAGSLEDTVSAAIDDGMDDPNGEYTLSADEQALVKREMLSQLKDIEVASGKLAKLMLKINSIKSAIAQLK